MEVRAAVIYLVGVDSTKTHDMIFISSTHDMIFISSKKTGQI
jgi:hypothetical protein